MSSSGDSPPPPKLTLGTSLSQWVADVGHHVPVEPNALLDGDVLLPPDGFLFFELLT